MSQTQSDAAVSTPERSSETLGAEAKIKGPPSNLSLDVSCERPAAEHGEPTKPGASYPVDDAGFLLTSPDPRDFAASATAGDGATVDFSGETDNALIERAALAAEQLHEYQFWFPFIEEERPTADGLLSFMVPPGALLAGLEAIALSDTAGKTMPVTITLTPGRARLSLERKGLQIEADVPLADFTNLPRNGPCLTTRYSRIRRLLAMVAPPRKMRLQEAESATFTMEPPTATHSEGWLTYRHRQDIISLPAEPAASEPPLSALDESHHHTPSVARTLARALRHASVFPKQTYFGPVVVSAGSARAFSRYGVLEYEHRELSALQLSIGLAYCSDLASALDRAKLGLRLVEQDSRIGFADGIIRYHVPKPTERMPLYDALKEEALSGPLIELDRKTFIQNVALLDAVAWGRGLPTTVQLVIKEQGPERFLYLEINIAGRTSWFRAGKVSEDFGVGEVGRVPIELLMKITKSAEFDSLELRLTKSAGALVQKGDGSIFTCIFPFREASDQDEI